MHQVIELNKKETQWACQAKILKLGSTEGIVRHFMAFDSQSQLWKNEDSQAFTVHKDIVSEAKECWSTLHNNSWQKRTFPWVSSMNTMQHIIICQKNCIETKICQFLCWLNPYNLWFNLSLGCRLKHSNYILAISCQSIYYA